MRGVEDMPAANGQSEQLIDFERRILAVLAWNVKASRHIGGLAVRIASAPIREDVALPRER